MYIEKAKINLKLKKNQKLTQKTPCILKKNKNLFKRNTVYIESKTKLIHKGHRVY